MLYFATVSYSDCLMTVTKLRLHACTGVLIALSMMGMMYHTISFNGMQHGTDPLNGYLWHGFYMCMNLLGLWIVLSATSLGYWWLLTAFLWQIPTEGFYAYQALSLHGNGLAWLSQIIEPGLNVLGLFCLIATRSRYGIAKVNSAE